MGFIKVRDRGNVQHHININHIVRVMEYTKPDILKIVLSTSEEINIRLTAQEFEDMVNLAL